MFESSRRMSQNDQFFGCFLPHLPERGTDHGYEHFPLGEMGAAFCMALIRRLAEARASLCQTSAERARTEPRASANDTRVNSASATWRVSVCYYSVTTIANLERHRISRGWVTDLIKITSDFSFSRLFLIARALFLFVSWMSVTLVFCMVCLECAVCMLQWVGWWRARKNVKVNVWLAAARAQRGLEPGELSRWSRPAACVIYLVAIEI